jgi:serine protease Do
LALIPILALAGCNQASPGPGTAANGSGQADEATAADATSESDDHSDAFKAQTHPLVSSGDVPLLEQINRENVRVVSAAAPSIVRVTAVGPVDPHAQIFGNLPFKIPGLPQNFRPVMPSYGSGVIISRDGYIVTNNHVVTEAQSVEVQMHDQRSFPARVLAADSMSDIAVLKINAKDLPAMPWGDSDKVQVGEQVFAIGNPFNLDDSVSKGIVSATGRNLPDSSNYEGYIQTDAAINVGNSGGALINIHGQLIGINCAIASFTRGSEGVGFSIPSNLVRYAVESLLKDQRGYLGVRLPAKIDEGVIEQLGLTANRGALLAGVLRSSPADQAKLRPVDFITAVDGHKVESVVQLRLVVTQIPVGKQVAVDFIRDGKPRTTTVKIAELPKDAGTATEVMPLSDLSDDSMPTDVHAVQPPPADHVLAGLQVADLTDKTREQFGVDDMVTSGVVVTGVQEGTPADERGLLRGDVIEIACAERGSVQPLASAGDFTGLTKKLKADQSVVLLVHHGRTSGQEDRSSMFLYLSPLQR